MGICTSGVTEEERGPPAAAAAAGWLTARACVAWLHGAREQLDVDHYTASGVGWSLRWDI